MTRLGAAAATAVRLGLGGRVGASGPRPAHELVLYEFEWCPFCRKVREALVWLDLDVLMAEDSTYFGDLFAHIVQWQGDLYLEDGLHRALRAALQQRLVLHARILELDADGHRTN